MSNSIVLDAAMKYAARGWPVFPLGPNSKAPHPQLKKMPSGEGGLYLATTDMDQIEAWFTQWGDANIGIACGATSGYDGPWVLDIDNKQGKHGSDDLHILGQKHRELPDTPTVFTPNSGEHRYFANDPRTRGKVNGKLYGYDSLDIQGTGCYVVAPPSVIGGKAYHEDAVYDFGTTPLAKLPQWLIDGMGDRAPDVDPVQPSGRPLDIDHLTMTKDMKMLLKGGDVLNVYRKGQETDTSKMLYDLEHALIRAGYGDADIVAVLMEPAHLGSAKARKQGEKWLLKDIGRARAKMAKENQQGTNGKGAAKRSSTPVQKNGQTSPSDETTHAEDIQALLDELQAMDTPDMRRIFQDDAIALYATMSDQDFALYRVELQKIFGRNLRWMDVKNVRKEARKRQRMAPASSAGIGAGENGTGGQEGGEPALTIVIGPDIERLVDEGITALETLPEAKRLYQRAGMLTILATGAKPPRTLTRTDDPLTIVRVQPERIRELAAASAQWQKFNLQSDEYVAAMPPTWFAQTVLGRPAWPFPPIEGIINAPTIRPDGSILTQHGYDAETGLYFAPNDTYFPPLPTPATRDDAYRALTTLHELTCDFPFATSGHRSAAWAALLTMVARHAIAGNTPLFAISSTTPATGKGKLADALSIVALGRMASKWAQSDEEEERKTMLTIAIAGDPVVLIDNINRALGSPALESALTAGTIQGRILGLSEAPRVPMTAVFLATGNNLRFKGDMVRRVVPINLVSTWERPEERTVFEHTPLEPWVHQERGRLVMAALTILAAYTEVGRPNQNLAQYGSFEAWSDLVRSALVWAEEEDPCKERATLAQENDSAYAALSALLEAWQACFALVEDGKSVPRTLRQVMMEIDAKRPVPTAAPTFPHCELLDALGDFDARYNGERLDLKNIGTALLKIEGRIVLGCRLQREKGSTRGARWYCERV